MKKGFLVMKSNFGKNRIVSLAREFALMVAALALGLAFGAQPAAAAPFAYVANGANVAVIDTATNAKVTSVPVKAGAATVAVTADGKRIYVPNGTNTVSVINAATNLVVATIPGVQGSSVAITPDGKFVYVAGAKVSVIDAAANKVVANVRFPGPAFGIAVTPDGNFVYVPNGGGATGSVSVIAAATNTLVVSIPVTVRHPEAGGGPTGITIALDGKFAYVPVFSKFGPNSISVIATATNKEMASVAIPGVITEGAAITPDGNDVYVVNQASALVEFATATKTVTQVANRDGSADSIAITPDGKSVYIANSDGTVTVIATAGNTVVTTLKIGGTPTGIAIVPPPPGILFHTFIAQLGLDLDPNPSTDTFALQSEFVLGQKSNGINPPAERVTLSVGTFTTIIPAGSFKGTGSGPFTFVGSIGGVNLQVAITPTGTKRYAFDAAAQNANLSGTTNFVPVTLIVGDDSGTASVNADIDH